MSTQTEALEKFVDKLLESKGLSETDPDVLAQLKQDLLTRVEDHVNAAILAEIPGDKIEEFNQILDKNNPEDVIIFCQSIVPDFQNVVAKTLLDFRNTYLGI